MYLHKFNFAKGLKAVQCNLMELKKTDCFDWVCLVKIDISALIIELDLATDNGTCTIGASNALGFFLSVYDHFVFKELFL